MYFLSITNKKERLCFVLLTKELVPVRLQKVLLMVHADPGKILETENLPL